VGQTAGSWLQVGLSLPHPVLTIDMFLFLWQGQRIADNKIGVLLRQLGFGILFLLQLSDFVGGNW